jgi:glycosyltransferase involved in cell wall biosynthesis
MDLRIAISTWDAPPAIGGPPRYIEELVKRLSNYIDIVLLVPSYASVKEKNGLEIRKIGSIDIPILRVCMFAVKASFLVKKIGVDLVHDNGVLGISGFSPFIETWHHSNLDDRRYLSFSAYYMSLYREFLTAKGINNADSIIAISSAAKKDLIDTHSVEDSKIHVVPHGVDTDFFKPIELCQQNKIKRDGKIYLLYVGALSKRKNLYSLIRAMKLIQSRRIDVQLLLIGDGDEKYRLQELVHALGLGKNVQFLGSVSQEYLLLMYNTADYVILPSYKEGFGMTVLEGLACGKPVIMTPVGISDIIVSNNLGVVADGFDPSSLATAIELAIADHNVKDLRAFVKANFSWERTIDKTLEVYRKTV